MRDGDVLSTNKIVVIKGAVKMKSNVTKIYHQIDLKRKINFPQKMKTLTIPKIVLISTVKQEKK
jgi:hypothetical protein